MRRIIRRALTVGLTTTLGAGIALFVTSGARARILDAYVVVMAGVAMLALVRALRLVARPQKSTFEQAVARARVGAPVRRAEVAEERDVVLSRLNAYHYYIRVRPVLREFADLRLRSRFGVDLEREPARARELVPARAWGVVQPDVPPPSDRLARGPSIDDQRQVLAELERLGA